jgi:putative tributyrin esterase
MALIRIDHVPQSVDLNLPLYLIIPQPGEMGGIPLSHRKVLYLLHGLSDDGSAWQRYTSIETLAASYGLVVVMPSVGRSFYTDQPDGRKYFTYLVEELPRYLSEVFKLSTRREDTLIAGNSMGGYGAFKAAFLHPERFFAAASFSGVLTLAFLHAFPDDSRLKEFAYLFGDLDQLSGSSHDPAVWYQRAAANPAALPRLFMSVGRQEDLYPLNQMVFAFFQELGIPVDYHEEDANHDWVFWDREIKRFLEAVLGPPPSNGSQVEGK